MGKLVIEYRTKDEENYLKGQTYFSYSLKNKATMISIAPEETRKLSEIVYGIEKELQDGYHLDKEERFEIEEADKSIMEYEEEKDCRIEAELYPILRMIYENKDNPEQLNQFLRIVKEGIGEQNVHN